MVELTFDEINAVSGALSVSTIGVGVVAIGGAAATVGFVPVGAVIALVGVGLIIYG